MDSDKVVDVAQTPAAAVDSVQSHWKELPSHDRSSSELVPFEQFIKQRVDVDATLWNALLEATRKEMGSASRTLQPGPAIGVVLAADPLLGFAAVQLVAGETLRVPVSQARLRKEDKDRPSRVVNMHGRLPHFVRTWMSTKLAGGPLLMLGWGEGDIWLNLPRADALEGRMICLVRADENQPPNDDPALLYDVSLLARSIIATTLMELNLPGVELADRQAAGELLEKLLHEGFSLDDIIDALNTPEQSDFRRMVYRLQAQKLPEVEGVFERCVLAAREDMPRHAAALFLVSHFSQLTPRRFMELADRLAPQTPAARRRQGAGRAPRAVTDQVLKECNIEFVARGVETPPHALMVRVNSDSSEENRRGSLRRAEHLRFLFESRAPLLRERYLQYLGDALTLGHDYQRIGEEFRRHEAQALRAIAQEEQYAAIGRLRRAVYGHLESSVGERPGAALEQARRLSAFVLAVYRAPTLIKELAGSSPELLARAVRVLCSPELEHSGSVSEQAACEGSARLFWLLYSQYPGQVTLRDFPSLFRRIETDARWRTALLEELSSIFYRPDENHLLRELADCFALPEVMLRLIADAIAHSAAIADDKCRSTLLADTSIWYLLKNIHGVVWTAVASWRPVWKDIDASMVSTGGEPCDLRLARLTQPMRVIETWIRASRSADEIGCAHALCWTTQLLLDALVGSAGFRDLEVIALDLWLAHVLGTNWLETNFGAAAFWVTYVAAGEPDVVNPPFAAAAGVLELFPLIMLMAATREPPTPQAPYAYSFSKQLKRWLGEIPRHGKSAPATELLDKVEAAFELQKQWQDAHQHIRLMVDWRIARAAFDDRRNALAAFAQALKPIAASARLATYEPQPATQNSGSTIA